MAEGDPDEGGIDLGVQFTQFEPRKGDHLLAKDSTDLAALGSECELELEIVRVNQLLNDGPPVVVVVPGNKRLFPGANDKKWYNAGLALQRKYKR